MKLTDAEFEVVRGPDAPLTIEREPRRLRFWQTRRWRKLWDLDPSYWRNWWAPYRLWLFLGLMAFFAIGLLLRPWLVQLGLVGVRP